MPLQSQAEHIEKFEGGLNYRGPGMYRHYKGGFYHVLGLALQEDTISKPNEWIGGRVVTIHYSDGESRELAPDMTPRHPVYYVIYEPLSPGSLLEEGEYVIADFWARELSNFNQMVDVSDYGFSDTGRRFEFLGRSKKIRFSTLIKAWWQSRKKHA